jgi:hypothetical protein
MKMAEGAWVDMIECASHCGTRTGDTHSPAYAARLTSSLCRSVAMQRKLDGHRNVRNVRSRIIVLSTHDSSKFISESFFYIDETHSRTVIYQRQETECTLERLDIPYNRIIREKKSGEIHTVHWTLKSPSRKAIPLFHPPVWFTSPAGPKTYPAECISDRRVIARRAMMITERDIHHVFLVRARMDARTESGAEVDEDEGLGETRKVARHERVLSSRVVRNVRSEQENKGRTSKP